MNTLRSLFTRLALTFSLVAAALIMPATTATAANVSYPFSVTDNTGLLVSGATIQVGATVLTAGSAATVSVKSLGTGNTVSGVTVKYIDFGDGFYVLVYDPVANGEAHIALSVSKSGSVITGNAATVIINATADSSLVTALPAAAPSSAGGLPTIGTGSGQISPSSGAVSAIVTDKTGFALSGSEHTAIAADVLDAATSAHATTGTIGKAISSAASAGDPWATALPGSYSAGSAGYIVGHNVDAQVSTRLPTSSYAAAPTTSQIAAAILSNPSNLLVTDSSGNVSLSAGTQSSIANAVLAATVDGTITVKQAQALHVAIMTGKYTTATASGVTTTTYYRQDGTTVIAVSTLTTSGGTTTRAWTLSNLP